MMQEKANFMVVVKPQFGKVFNDNKTLTSDQVVECRLSVYLAFHAGELVFCDWLPSFSYVFVK